MKKKITVIVLIIVVLFFISIVAKYIDGARVRNGIEPKLTIKTVSYDGSKVTYWGLGYKVIRYVGVSPKEPYANNIGVKMGNWFMRYELEETSKNEITNSINNKIQEDANTYTKTETQWKIENVKITLKEDSITKTSAIINIVDKNETPKSWGMDFGVQKSGDNDKWVDMITKEKITWLEIAIEPNENGVTEMQLDWSKLYGELNTGTYRIIKNNGLSTLHSEPFTIK